MASDLDPWAARTIASETELMRDAVIEKTSRHHGPEFVKMRDMPRIKASSIAGQGLFTTKDLPVGAMTLGTRAMFIALDAKRLPDTCAYCLTWAAQSKLGDRGSASKITMKVCTACKTNRYCSKKCQLADWKRTHKIECKILKKTNEKGVLPNAARLVVQMMQFAPSWEHTPTKHLSSHLSEILSGIDPDRRETFLVLSTGIYEYSDHFVSLDIIQSLLGIVFTNSLTAYTSTFDPLGICVDPVACVANHSCEPNVSVVFDGRTLFFRALKALKKDEELLLPYIDISEPYHRRQAQLEERYYFKCRCDKCKLGPIQKEDIFRYSLAALPKTAQSQLMDAAGKIRDTNQKELKPRPSLHPNRIAKDQSDSLGLAAEKIQAHGYAVLADAGRRSGEPDFLNELDAALRSCTLSGIWPEVRQPIPALRQEIFISLLMMGKWTLAFRHGIRMYLLIHAYGKYPLHHPSVVVHRWTLAMLALYLADNMDWPDVKSLIDSGVDFTVVIFGLLMEVGDNIEKSHGDDTDFTRNVKRKIQEVYSDASKARPKILEEVADKIGLQWQVLRKIADDKMLEGVGL